MAYLNAKQVAEMLGVSVATLYRWMDEGRFPKPKRINHTVRWDPEAIKAFMSADADTAA